MTRQNILRKLAFEGYTQREIALKLGVAQKTIQRWLLYYHIPFCRKPYYGKNMQSYYDARILRLCNYSYKKIAEMLNLTPNKIKNWVDDLPCHATIVSTNRSSRIINDINKAKAKHVFRRELIKLRGSKCETCGTSHWLGKRLALHVHHIDGNKYNNVLGNLKVMCPNCHSLTKNYCGKNKK